MVYAFRLSIGDTDTDKFDDGAQPVSAWLIFILCALFTNIIMLNLLIALISESFGKINSNSISANYQERARLISENAYLIPASVKEAYCERQRYLIVADEVREADKEEKQKKKEAEGPKEEERVEKMARKVEEGLKEIKEMLSKVKKEE